MSPNDQQISRTTDVAKAANVGHNNRIKTQTNFFGVTPKSPPSFFPHNAICVPFVGRDEILIKIKNHLLGNPVEERTDPNRRFVLWGGLGTGKKQVCLKFALDNKNSFSNVWMINASHQNSIEANFRAIAEDLELPLGLTPGESIDTVKSWLARQTGWLLIFDDAEDEVLQRGHYFPGGTGGMILIAGHDSKLQKHAVPNDYGAKSCLRSLSNDESNKLLLTLCRTMSEKEEYQPEEQGDEINHLADKITYDLGYNPQAICIVGRMVGDGYEATRGFLQDRMRTWRETFFGGEFNTTNSESNYAIQKPVEQALERIRSKANATKRGFTHALELMQLLTVLDVSDISVEILKYSWINWRNFPAWWRTTYTHQYGFLMHNVSVWEAHQITNALEVLHQSGLLSFSKSKYISMNRYVRLCAYNYLRGRDTQLNHIRAISTVAQSISWSEHISEHSLRTSVVTHIDKLRNVPRGSPLEDFDDREDCVDFWQHESIIRQLGSQTYLDIMLKFAAVYYENGRYTEAAEMQRHAACVARSQLGMSHRTTSRAVCELANTLQTLGEHEEALSLREEAYEIRKNYKISAWQLFVLWWGSFGAITLTYSRFPPSIDDIHSTFRAILYIHSWISLLIKPGLIGPLKEDLRMDRLLIMSNLADSYGRVPDRKGKALEMRREVLTRLKDWENERSNLDAKALEMIQDFRIAATAKVADSHYNLRNRQEAMELRRDVYNLCKEREKHRYHEKSGLMHLTTIQASVNFAESLCDIGQVEESLKIREDVLCQQRIRHPEIHYKVTLAKAELAISHSKLKDYDEAKTLRQQVVDNLVELLGEGHTRTLTAQVNLGRSFAKLKDWKQALQVQIHVFQKRRVKFGYQNRDTLLSVEYIVKILRELPSKLAKGLATKLQMQVLRSFRAKPIGDKFDVLQAMSAVADCHEAASHENFEIVDDLRCKVLQEQRHFKDTGAIHMDSLRVMEQRADSIDKYYVNHFLPPTEDSSQGSSKSAPNSQGQTDPSDSATILEEEELPDVDEAVFNEFLEQDLGNLEVLNGSDNKIEDYSLFEPISLKGTAQEDKAGYLESKSVAFRKFIFKEYEKLGGLDRFVEIAEQKSHTTELLYNRPQITKSKKVKVEEKKQNVLNWRDSVATDVEV